MDGSWNYWIKLGLIAGGGAVGSVARYALQGWGQHLTQGGFPLGTLLVNVAGCIAIGAVSALFAGPLPLRPEYRVGLTIGLLGGFTTFSALGWETFSLLNDRQYATAAANVLLSVGLGLAGVWVGYRVVERTVGL